MRKKIARKKYTMSRNNRSSLLSGQGSSPWPMNTVTPTATPSMPSDYTPQMSPPGAPVRGRLQRTSSSGSVTGPLRGGSARRQLFSPPVTPPRTPTPSLRRSSTMMSPSPSMSTSMMSPSPAMNGALKDRVRDLKRRIEALEAEKEELKRSLRR